MSFTAVISTTLVTKILSTLLIFFKHCNARDHEIPKLFPTMLVFGDSTVDSGNNNHINTPLKSNFFPYGKDFLPTHESTGRFSNGKIVTDFIAYGLGIKETVPPFLGPSLSEDDIVTGVSFASGGTGYDDLTASISSAISMSNQIQLFSDYIVRLKRIVGEEKGEEMIEKALVVVSAGTNDLVINFYDLHTRSLEFDLNGYQDFLLNKLADFLEELYTKGCRRIVVAGLPPVGCLPIQITTSFFQNPSNRKCLKNQNAASQLYNAKLQKLLPQIQSSLPGSIVCYADIYDPIIEMINHPKKYGFVETKRGCCGSGFLEAALLCNPLTPTCEKASEFIFWDSIHPTQATYKYLATYTLNKLLPIFLNRTS